MKKIALVGSTGSIGTQVLNCVRRHSDKFTIVSLSAGTNAKVFLQQVNEFKPKVATLIDGKSIDKNLLPKETEFFFGENAFTNAIIEDCDIVVVSLVGFKGIIAVLDAIEKNKNIALANKESLVVGGELVIKKAKEKGVSIVPIDSEHSAIWQALNFDFNHPFRKIILTASGGAFRDYSLDQLKTATYKDALKHPNWSMGNKITIDCATLVNKGFEVIEAKWLYNTTFDKIDVIIHRESIIHSMVEMEDSSVIAQLSYPSMELPIQLALTYPERFNTDIKSLDFASIGKLTFSKPDNERFPCLNLVIEAGKEGGLSTTIVNGANEEAVKLFLQGKISFNDIYKAISNALLKIDGGKIENLDSLLETDKKSREYVRKLFGE
ncbi:MAG: 1-deoxy-D-xylulose-5-phosphate reductoisomerase [Firmicutes bacterium]|nr:1-deoxy-D-xylulose-5-phosphate reductoisomerase [Candidatus Caballimonas caccae]